MRPNRKVVAVLAIVILSIGLVPSVAHAAASPAAGPRVGWLSLYEAVLDWGQLVACWIGFEESPGRRGNAATAEAEDAGVDPDGSTTWIPSDDEEGLITQPVDPDTGGNVGPGWDPNG